MENRLLIIGIGNADRGDDAAGPAVIAELEKRTPRPFDTALCHDDLTRLMELWRGRRCVVLVDMVSIPGAAHGTVHRFDVRTQALPYALSCSSHTLGLSQCIELARTLGQLPQEISIIGINGADTDVGTAPSTAVVAAVKSVADELGAEFVQSASGAPSEASDSVVGAEDA